MAKVEGRLQQKIKNKNDDSMAQKMGKKEEDKKKKSEKHSHHDKPSVPGYNARLNPISPS